MIRHISGTIIDAAPDSVVLDVRGVGYLVYTAIDGTSLDRSVPVSFWTYQAVRETALDLYGFGTRDELEIFELLLTLPKIGPKSAISIMAQADIALLKKAVLSDDPTYLSKMSGIGKKSAEKIVAGLKDKFDDLDGFVGDNNEEQPTTTHQADAIDALVSLGYPQADARRAVQSLPADITDPSTAVREALKLLST